MSALPELVARMPVLAAARHPFGLSPARAAEFSALVQSTGDVGASLRTAGSDPHISALLDEAKAPDAVAVVLRLVGPVGEVATLRRTLQSAAGYPLALLASFALAAWAVFTVSIPALVTLGATSGELYLTELAVLAVCLALLLAVALLTATGARVPGFRRGHALLDRALVLESAAVLVEAQVPLPRALTAASVHATGRMRVAAEDLGRAFAAGSAPTGAAVLLDGDAAAILGASAQRGVAAPVLRALAGQAVLDARRQLPAEARRIHTVSLLLAGAALLTLAIGWYQAYVHAVVD